MNAMTSAIDAATAVSTPHALARGYQLLALGFAYPDTVLADLVASAIYRDELVAVARSALPNLAEVATQWSGAFSGIGMAELESGYLAAFELDAPKRMVSLYEGSYAGCDRAQLLLEVKAFYQHFGLSVSDTVREAEDHLAAELEFMQFLVAKQAIALDAGGDAGPYVRAQRDFLSRHLGRWLPRFAAATASLDSDFYRSLAWFANAFVTAHRALVGLPEGEGSPS